jgi:UDP-galactopyranose mutase
VPTRTNRDDRYFTDTYQAMPLRGFTSMFERMLDHPNIKILLNTDYHEIEGSILYDEIICTAPIDEYFDYRFGKLPYRSLTFEWETRDAERVQPVAVLNYPNDNLYTRVTEFKHITGQQHPKTTRVYEYPQAVGDPYYPIPRAENMALYKRYEELASVTPGVWFVGRLGTYKYYNMDQVVAQSLATFAKIAGVPRAQASHRDRSHRTADCRLGQSRVHDQPCWRSFSGSARLLRPLQPRRRYRCDRAVGDHGTALWERVAPDGVSRADWRGTDRALNRLRELGIEPIVGFVHPGSGPAGTHLLDPAFGAGLAAYAGAFAERYPWIRRYTPINEPLTTARFSALYGVWYPHLRDDRAFVTARSLNQCCAIADAMAAIRVRVPDAELVQTEDAALVSSTAEVSEQAGFENHRRWISLDLLAGHVDEEHPLTSFICGAGANRDQLARLLERPAPPSVVGLNYYVTSDRFLDHRLDRQPPSSHGGNGRQRYADVAAVRVPEVGLRGHAAVLLEAWRRYGLPVAITEAHLVCTREEQMRWLVDGWQGAREAAAGGADVRAVTAWALLGSWDWDALLSRTVPLRVGSVRRPRRRETGNRGRARDRRFGCTAYTESSRARRTGLVETHARPVAGCVEAGADRRRGRHAGPGVRARLRESRHRACRVVQDRDGHHRA